MPKYAELKRELKKAGCYLHHEGGGHEHWYSPITDETFQISRHNQQEVKPATEKSIRKKAGVPKKR